MDPIKIAIAIKVEILIRGQAKINNMEGLLDLDWAQ
jgi:hypothetical protein